jgi:hypothetical protein
MCQFPQTWVNVYTAYKHRSGWRSGNALHFYSRDVWFEPRPGHKLSCLRSFVVFSSPPEESWNSNSLRPRPIIHPFDATQSVISPRKKAVPCRLRTGKIPPRPLAVWFRRVTDDNISYYATIFISAPFNLQTKVYWVAMGTTTSLWT